MHHLAIRHWSCNLYINKIKFEKHTSYYIEKVHQIYKLYNISYFVEFWTQNFQWKWAKKWDKNSGRGCNTLLQFTYINILLQCTWVLLKKATKPNDHCTKENCSAKWLLHQLLRSKNTDKKVFLLPYCYMQSKDIEVLEKYQKHILKTGQRSKTFENKLIKMDMFSLKHHNFKSLIYLDLVIVLSSYIF